MTSTSDNTQTSLFTAGERLKQTREQQGMSIEDVAGKLKLTPRQITAIEAEDWAALPERPFTRGFMRGYARTSWDLIPTPLNQSNLKQNPTVCYAQRLSRWQSSMLMAVSSQRASRVG